MTSGALGATLAQGEPIFTPDDVTYAATSPPGPPAFWLDVESVRSPQVLLTPSAASGSSLRVWFSAFGRESADTFQFGEYVPVPANYSIGYATLDPSDPSRFTMWPYNPVVDQVQAFLEHRSELSPAVVQISDKSGTPSDGYLLYTLDAETETANGPFSLNRIGVMGNGGYQSTTGP